MTAASSVAFVLRASFAALAPSRLAWGVACVLVLMIAGRLADLAYLAVGGRPISPSGLAVGAWTSEQAKQAQRAVARDISVLALGTSVSAPSLADTPTSELAGILEVAYRERLEKDAAASTTLASAYRKARAGLDGLRERGPAEALGRDTLTSIRRMAAAAYAAAPFGVLDAGLDALVRRPIDLVRTAPWYALILGIPLAAVGSLLAGGLARMAVCDAGRAVKLSLVDTATFVRRHWGRFVLLPIVPSLVFAFVVAVLILIGFGLRVPLVNIVAGFLYGPALLLAVLVVIVGVALLLTWPLTLASIATGDSDAVDAVVRTTAYVLRRPGMTVLVLASSMIAVALGLLVAGGVAWIAMGLTETAVGLGAGGAVPALGDAGLLEPASAVPPAAGATDRIAGGFIDLWESILVLAVHAAAVSLIFDAGARAYLALRFRCDGQDPSAIAEG